MSKRPILTIYSHYKIPPSLARHMLEVAAVGRFLCDHWRGSPIDKDLITRTLLLHDMGNIIKFKRPFLGDLEPDAAYWESVQAEYIEKYGANVHSATISIASELGASDVLPILNEMKEGAAIEYNNVNLNTRICEYADCCVMPKGIVTSKERIADLQARYGHADNDPWTISVKANAAYVEKQLDINPNDLTKHNFQPEIETFKQFSL